jgi:hypothetical protein
MNALPRIRLRYRKGRRKPTYEVRCSCTAYKYPHRFGSGACNGYSLVEYFWENLKCGDCRHKDFNGMQGIPSCQVLNGREKIVYCEQLQEFLRENEAYTKKLARI